VDYDGIPMTDFYLCAEAGRKLPGRRSGRPISGRTLQRYRNRGVLRLGVRVRLRALKIGSDWHTCDRWVQEFLAQINGGVSAAQEGAGRQQQAPRPTANIRSPGKQERASEVAKRRLEELWASKHA
jgi:hypothetical protein